MALTQEQRDQMRYEYERRLAVVSVEKRDGGSVQFATPIGGIDYLDLGGIDKILRHLGYQVANVRREGALLSIVPLEQEPAEGD